MSNHPSIIARPTPTGFAGRYVHNDGHPDMRLPLLRNLYAGPFAGDLDAMLRFLVDDHPAGWSQLGPDPSRDTGFVSHVNRPIAQAMADRDFRCYCHGDRHEAPRLNTEANTDPVLADWIYVLRPDGIDVVQAAGDGVTWLPARLKPWGVLAPATRHTRKESA
jgi:hypothetical protein